MEVLIVIFLGALGSIAAAEIWAWIPTACHSLVEFSVKQLPEHLRERMHEEWLGTLNEYPGNVSKLVFALDLVRVGPAVKSDELTVAQVRARHLRFFEWEAVPTDISQIKCEECVDMFKEHFAYAQCEKCKTPWTRANWYQRIRWGHRRPGWGHRRPVFAYRRDK
jgi:hypothetical protein